MPRPRLPLNLPLAITVLAWGFNFVGLTILYKEVTPAAVSLVRFGGMWLLLMALCLLVRESLKYPKEDLWRLLYFGFMSMGVYMWFFLEGLAGTAPAEAAILLNTSPILTMFLLAAMGQEKLRAGAVTGTVVAFLGVSIVIVAGTALGHSTPRGIALTLTSAAVWAYCVVLMKPLLEKYSPLRVLTLSMPGGLLVLLPYGLWAVIHTDFAALSPTAWVMFFHVSVISGVVAFVCFYKGVRMAGGNGAMLSMFFVPPTAAFFAWLMLHRTLVPAQFVGLAVVILGVFWAQRSRMQAGQSAGAAAPAERPAEGTI